MPEWINTSAIVIAVIAIIAAAVNFGRWQGTVNTTLKNFGESLSEIKIRLNEIFNRLPVPGTAHHTSPLSLNKLGQEVAKEMGVERWASEMAPSLLTEVQGMEPFQIDEFSLNYTQSRLTDQWEKIVATTAYNRGLSRGDVHAVLHITLRDELIRLIESD